MAKKENYKKEN